MAMTRDVLNKALLEAAEAGDLDKVRELVANGARIDAVDKVGQQPLQRAASHGHLSVMEFLVEHGANSLRLCR